VRFWIPWGLGFGLWALAMVLAAPCDLPLCQAVVDAGAFDSWFVLRFGEIPGWILIAMSLWALVAGRKETSRLRPWRPLGTAIIIQALALPLLVTQSLKYFWGRVRFIHLHGDLSGFPPFWTPAGVGAGHSFPSGHVAMAVVGAAIPFFLWRKNRKGTALQALALIAAWGAFVSWGRIRAGSHYLTDCVFSFGAAWLVGGLLARAWATCER